MEMLLNGRKEGIGKREQIEVYNPATNERIDAVPGATVEDLEEALESARLGGGLWGETPLLQRAAILERISVRIEEEKEPIASLLAKEAGKIYRQAIAEVEHAVALFKEYAYRLRLDYGAVMPSDNDMIWVEKEPLGVVACILPFNFPIELYAHKVAPALAAGNAVIIKPSIEAPLAVLYISELILQCGVPDQALQVITGKGSVIGGALASSEKIDAISMTGSTEVGISVYQAAAKNLSKCYLELGGNDPLIVFDDTDVEYAVEEAINGRILHAGQACCSSKRFIIQENIYDAFAKSLVRRLSGLKLGDPFDEETDIGPLISEKAALEVESIVERTINSGAECILGGKRRGKSYFEPTVLTDVTPDMEIAQNQEVFGPVFPLIRFRTEEEAVYIANHCMYGLSSGVISCDMKRALRVARKLDAGNCTLNGSGLYRTHDMPFGGHRHSGLGTEGLYHTLDEFMKTKSFVWKGARCG